MTRTNGCNGSCCAVFPLNDYTIEAWNEYVAKWVDPPEIQAAYPNRVKTQDQIEIEKIAAMVIHIGTGDRGEARFTCSHFDAEAKLCMNYEDRPNLCRDYPYFAGRSCNHCNLTLTQINGLEIAGGFGHEPFISSSVVVAAIKLTESPSA